MPLWVAYTFVLGHCWRPANSGSFLKFLCGPPPCNHLWRRFWKSLFTRLGFHHTSSHGVKTKFSKSLCKLLAYTICSRLLLMICKLRISVQVLLGGPRIAPRIYSSLVALFNICLIPTLQAATELQRNAWVTYTICSSPLLMITWICRLRVFSRVSLRTTTICSSMTALLNVFLIPSCKPEIPQALWASVSYLQLFVLSFCWWSDRTGSQWTSFSGRTPSFLF